MKEKPLYKAGDFCQVGDVFILTKLDATERKYNGCWAIALALNEFTVEVAVHDNTLIVHSENLNKIDSPEAQHQLPLLQERIWRLRNGRELYENYSKPKECNLANDKLPLVLERCVG